MNIILEESAMHISKILYQITILTGEASRTLEGKPAQCVNK